MQLLFLGADIDALPERWLSIRSAHVNEEDPALLITMQAHVPAVVAVDQTALLPLQISVVSQHWPRKWSLVNSYSS